YDPRGDGRAIEVVGDLATAQHIAVLVPGVGWDLAKLLADGGRDPSGPLFDARALVGQAHRLDPAARVAAVAWLGYDPPEGIDLQAVRSERAVAGAGVLARFVAGLRATAGTAATITLICHSYGAVVCGHAVAAGATGVPLSTVDDLVVLAAPGLDVANRSALVGAGRVWAARAVGDPIRFTPFVRVAGLGHGADPTGAGFGALVLRTGSARGHGGYYRPGTESLTNLARVLLRTMPEVSNVDS
ncbi:MAG: hypothetical protein J2P15_01095, partial [Micromonosporaceae bacterium]|nr:hypothetical protein [Micromonosporaceae bacterium]